MALTLTLTTVEESPACLETHDFEIPLRGSMPQKGAAARRLRVKLLMPDDNQQDNKAAIPEKLERLISLTGGDDVAVALGLPPVDDDDNEAQDRYRMQPWLEMQQL